MSQNLIALIAATSVLVLIPGPNVALIVANTLAHGLRFGLLTVIGTTLGVALQLVLVVAGMATVIEVAAAALSWIKWLGVAYLVWLGVRTYLASPLDLAAIEAQSRSRIFWRGFLLAIVNPKILLFNAAFLPQFVSSDARSGMALLSVAAVFLLVVFAGDILWAVFSSSAGRLLARVGDFRNKVAGAFLASAGIALALSRRNA